MHQAESLRANRRRYHRSADGEGFHDFQAGSATDSQWNHLQPGTAVIGAHVRDASGHGDSRPFTKGSNFRGRIFSDDQNAQRRNRLSEGRKNLREEPAQCVHVRIVIHGAAEKDGRFRRSFFIAGRGKEILQIHPIAHDRDIHPAANITAEEGFIVRAANDFDGRAPRHRPFIKPEFWIPFIAQETVP